MFTGTIKATVPNTRVVIFYALEKSKETILEFSKETTKVLSIKVKSQLNILLLVKKYIYI